MPSPKVEKIIWALNTLSEAERAELAFLLQGETESGLVISQESLTETFGKSHSVHMGPINRNTCSWCGK